MDEIGILIKRNPYEEPYLLDLKFTAFNGEFQGQFEWYCNPSELEEIGKALSPFPTKIPDEYSYDVDRNWFRFTIRATAVLIR
jgi:hypothetical protein